LYFVIIIIKLRVKGSWESPRTKWPNLKRRKKKASKFGLDYANPISDLLLLLRFWNCNAQLGIFQNANFHIISNKLLLILLKFLGFRWHP